MAFPPAHNRLSFTGTLNSNEIFSFSLADSSGLSPKLAAQAAQGPAQGRWTTPNAQVGAGAHLRAVVCEAINSGGAVVSSYAQPTVDTVGSALGANCNILTQCLTLETATDNGHGRNVRGRFYPPGYCASISGATVDLGDTNLYAQSWKDFISDLNTAGLAICVASTTDGGQLAAVIGVSADNVIDTQRRRKNQVRGQRTGIKLL